MKNFGATITISLPVTFKAENMVDARQRAFEAGRSMLIEKIRNSALVTVKQSRLQEILILEEEEDEMEVHT